MRLGTSIAPRMSINEDPPPPDITNRVLGSDEVIGMFFHPGVVRKHSAKHLELSMATGHDKNSHNNMVLYLSLKPPRNITEHLQLFDEPHGNGNAHVIEID